MILKYFKTFFVPNHKSCESSEVSRPIKSSLRGSLGFQTSGWISSWDVDKKNWPISTLKKRREKNSLSIFGFGGKFETELRGETRNNILKIFFPFVGGRLKSFQNLITNFDGWIFQLKFWRSFFSTNFVKTFNERKFPQLFFFFAKFKLSEIQFERHFQLRDLESRFWLF